MVEFAPLMFSPIEFGTKDLEKMASIQSGEFFRRVSVLCKAWSSQVLLLAGLSFLLLSVLLQSGCSTSSSIEKDRPASQYALTTNLSDSFGRLYPKIYINGSYVFRDKLLLTPNQYHFKITYRDAAGLIHTENMQVKIESNHCYYLQRKDGRFRFNANALDGDICSDMIDRTRYEMTYFRKS
ncbi:hypothetical protein THIOSC15_3620013 [uncultured Thiomicrorhabdus sp.]